MSTQVELLKVGALVHVGEEDSANASPDLGYGTIAGHAVISDATPGKAPRWVYLVRLDVALEGLQHVRQVRPAVVSVLAVDPSLVMLAHEWQRRYQVER